VVRKLRPPAAGPATGSMVLRSEGLVDLATFGLRNLMPNADYDIFLSSAAQAPYSRDYALTTVRTDATGNAMGQALGPVQRVATGDLNATGRPYLRVVVASQGPRAAPVLVGE